MKVIVKNFTRCFSGRRKIDKILTFIIPVLSTLIVVMTFINFFIEF